MRTFHKSLPAQLAVLLGLVLMLAPGASAAGPPQLPSFGSFAGPVAVGVDQSTGDVYVLDAGTQTLDRFNAEGVEEPFTAVESYVAGNEITGTPGVLPGEVIPFGFAATEAQVAVDGSTGPTQGEIYVTDATNEKVDVFAADGTFLGEVNPTIATPLKGGTPCGVAVDPAGDMYIAHSNSHVDEYAPVDGTPADDAFLRQIPTGELTCNIAVDSTGTVYGASLATAAVSQYPATSGQTSFGFPSLSVAVNPADDHVFADQIGDIQQYNSSLAPQGAPFGTLAGSFGVAVDAATGNVYALDGTQVDVFQTGIAGPPSILSTLALNVASTSTELEATIDPNLSNTHYYFQYGTDTSYTAGSVPNTAGLSIGESAEPQQAHVAISALQPNTTYHYRVTVISELEGKTQTAEGPDQTFTTPQTPPAPPAGVIVNPPVETTSAGVTPQPPTTYPNLTTLKPIPGPKETASKPKPKAKTRPRAKPCRKGPARKHDRCVKQTKTKQANHDKGSK